MSRARRRHRTFGGINTKISQPVAARAKKGRTVEGAITRTDYYRRQGQQPPDV